MKTLLLSLALIGCTPTVQYNGQGYRPLTEVGYLYTSITDDETHVCYVEPPYLLKEPLREGGAILQAHKREQITIKNLKDNCFDMKREHKFNFPKGTSILQ